MHYHLSVLSTGGQKQASEDVCQAMSVFVGLSLPTSQVLPTPQCLLSPHTLLVRKSWLLELTDGFTGLYCVALIFRAFISLLSWPPIYLPHSEAVGSPDLELSTSSHICLVCKSIYCCIHSFPMCFTGTPKKTVTSGIGSGHSQLSSHLCNCFFSVFQGLFDGSVSLHPSAAPYQFFGCVNEHHVCFPRADSLGSFLFLWYFSSCLQLSADFCLCLFTCLTKGNGKRLYTSLKQPLTYLLLHHLRLQMIANPHAFFSVSIQVSSN